MSFKSSLKGWFGELSTTLGHKVFLGSAYRDINNVTIETTNGTTQIDHVIVSKFGIFVTETKNMNGWIFGSENQAQWTQVFPNKTKFKFQNPLRQNYRHMKAISEFLGITDDKIHSVVMFWGECELKTEMPPNVITKGYATYIKSKVDVLFAEEEVDAIFTALKEGRLPKTFATKRRHLSSLRERHESETTCPKCNSELVQRTAKKGANAGRQFLGCSNFPKCRYVRNLV